MKITINEHCPIVHILMWVKVKSIPCLTSLTATRKQCFRFQEVHDVSVSSKDLTIHKFVEFDHCKNNIKEAAFVKEFTKGSERYKLTIYAYAVVLKHIFPMNPTMNAFVM